MSVWQYSMDKAFSRSWPIVLLSGVFISLRIPTERSQSQLVYYYSKRYLIGIKRTMLNMYLSRCQRMMKVRNDWKQLLQNKCTVYRSLINTLRDAHTRKKAAKSFWFTVKVISSANVYKHEYSRLFQLSSVYTWFLYYAWIRRSRQLN